MEAHWDAIRMTPLFQGLSDPEFEQLLSLTVPIEAGPGDRILRQGEPGDGLFLLAEGQVSVSRRESSLVENILTTLDAVTVFGEMALLSGEARQASIYAESRVRLYKLPVERWEALVSAGGPLATKLLLNIARTLGKRIARLDEELLTLTRATRSPSDRTDLGSLRELLARDWGGL